jgi:hypothetical protein
MNIESECANRRAHRRPRKTNQQTPWQNTAKSVTECTNIFEPSVFFHYVHTCLYMFINFVSINLIILKSIEPFNVFKVFVNFYNFAFGTVIHGVLGSMFLCSIT